MFYSKTTGGFYDESIHGSRLIEVVQTDPDTGETIDRWCEPNPDCKIPLDAVEITAEEHAALFAGQSAGKLIVADENGRPILQDPPPTTASEIWDHIKSKRDAIKAGGVKVGTKWYHTDTESRIQHLGLLEKARAARAAGGTDATRLQALGQDIKWKTMDGSFIYLTVKHAEDIFAAVTDLDAAAFAAAETHRVAMEASADPAAYDFSVGWPQSYAEWAAAQQ